jgi:hypothetical protein
MNWTMLPATAVSGFVGYDVTWTGSRWLAAGQAPGPLIIASTDGINWVSVNTKVFSSYFKQILKINTCSSPNTCICAAGWSGAQCQTPAWVCSSPCQNGGTCSGVNTCTCLTGWAGAQCQTPTCASACQNGGTCSSPNTCTCLTGWTGAQCQTSQCSQPCQNGGTCSGLNTCTCVQGWAGAQCQTRLCDPRLKSIVLTNDQGVKIVPKLVDWYDLNSAVAKAFGTVIPYTIFNPSLIPEGYECDWLPLSADPECYTFDAAAWNGTATAPTFKVTLEQETLISSAALYEYTGNSTRKFAVKLYYIKDNTLTEYKYPSSGAVSTLFASVNLQ